MLVVLCSTTAILLGVALLDLDLPPSSGVGFIEVGLILVAILDLSFS